MHGEIGNISVETFGNCASNCEAITYFERAFVGGITISTKTKLSRFKCAYNSVRNYSIRVLGIRRSAFLEHEYFKLQWARFRSNRSLGERYESKNTFFRLVAFKGIGYCFCILRNTNILHQRRY